MIINNKYLQITGFLTLLAFQHAQAAKVINLRHQPLNFFLTYAASNKLVGQNAQANSGIKVLKREFDFNQTAHIKIQQTYRNYPVWGGNMMLHIPHSKQVTNNIQTINAFSSLPPSTKMNGSLYGELDQDLSYAPPFIFHHQQKDKAWNHLTQHYLSLEKTDKSIRTSDTMLVYVDHGKARWAYKFDVAIARLHRLQRLTFIMDALTFELFKHWDEMQYLETNDINQRENPDNATPIVQLEEVKGGGMGGNLNAVNIYDGMRGNKTSLDIRRDNHKHICYMRNDNVVIKRFKFDVRTWSYTGDVIQYSCDRPDAQHGNTYWNAMFDVTRSGGLSPSNDAMYAASFVNEVYQSLYEVSVLRRDSIEPYDLGDGDEVHHRMININVHADMDTSGNIGCFDPVANELVLGDGDGKQFYPFTSLDVIAHELTHGFTIRYAGFINEGQPAALNEAFSDMATQIVQYYANNGKNNWMIAPEILVDARRGKALRYMDNPRKDCIGYGREESMCSIDNAKDYKDYMDAHHSCGVFNKAFYLLSTSPNWDIKKAFDVMIQANMRYWLSNSDFNEAACGVLDAAKDYGYEPDAIHRAFNAVGIATDKC